MIASRTLKLVDRYNLFSSKNKDGAFKGYFFVYDTEDKNVENAHECRENFADCFDDESEWIGFYHPKLDLKLINRFLVEVRKKLNLDEKIIFYQTNIKNAVVIKVPRFWLSSETKRAILTLFIRCGAVYYPKTQNFDEAIKSYELTNAVKNALDWFLKGNTKAVRNISGGGFVGTYENLSIGQIKKRLVKP